MSQYRHCFKKEEKNRKDEKQKEEFDKEGWHWSIITNVICIIYVVIQ